jgi:hypothetical protein
MVPGQLARICYKSKYGRLASRIASSKNSQVLAEYNIGVLEQPEVIDV